MNNKIGILKIFFLSMSLFMIYWVVVTSLRSNLLEALPILNSQPWFVTTIIDFYFNIAIFSAWVIYKEKSILVSASWVVSFILLGSIATAFYVFFQLNKLNSNESLEKALLRKGQVV